MVDQNASQGQSFGVALPDQVERISCFFDAHLEIWELYTARIALEREFASKLQVLARKALEKKAKALSVYVFGSDPTKSWDTNMLKQCTLENAYEGLIMSLSTTAQDHINFADGMTSQTVEILRILEKRNKESKKKEMAFFQKLLSDWDRVYADRIKGHASDDKHTKRAVRQAEQQQNNMLNSKK
uniref:FCH domain-containing protein n=1 Tax=Psilocybe cubensis TaxID=181762 RepID=A0A8H8CFL0_PSICU